LIFLISKGQNDVICINSKNQKFEILERQELSL